MDQPSFIAVALGFWVFLIAPVALPSLIWLIPRPAGISGRGAARWRLLIRCLVALQVAGVAYFTFPTLAFHGRLLLMEGGPEADFVQGSLIFLFFAALPYAMGFAVMFALARRYESP